MKNNNNAIIKKLVKRSLKTNKKRNIFITAAIALTTLLIASVFSIGMSIMESMKMQEIRLMGTVAHAAVTYPTREQIDKLKQLDYVKVVGTENSVATVKTTPQMGDMILTLHYHDKTSWDKLRAPAFTDIVGSYPQKENEIMVPFWVLERLGIEKPVIGMEIPLSYYTDAYTEDITDEVFILSGWFTSYMHIRSGNIDSILVSKQFSDKYKKTPQTSGSATVIFDRSPRVIKYCERLKDDLKLSGNQSVKPVPSYEESGSDKSSGLLAIISLIIFLILTGYLLIYNVLYISVTKDVRFYGLRFLKPVSGINHFYFGYNYNYKYGYGQLYCLLS